MDWKDVGQAIAKSARALGAALGGPAGAALGGIVAGAFGAEAAPDQVAAAIATDPQAAVRLREIELKHAEVVTALATQQYSAVLADVQHARAAHAGHWMPAALTISLAMMVAGLAAALITLQMPADNQEILYLIAGQLLGAFATAIAYWLGSSRGSAEKQKLLDRRG